MTGSKNFTVVRGAFILTCDHGESKKKTTPAGQCRTPNFVACRPLTTDTLNTLQTNRSNVGRGGCVGGGEPRKLSFVGPFVLGVPQYSVQITSHSCNRKSLQPRSLLPPRQIEPNCSQIAVKLGTESRGPTGAEAWMFHHSSQRNVA